MTYTATSNLYYIVQWTPIFKSTNMLSVSQWSHGIFRIKILYHTRKTLTWGRTDYFVAGVTYLPFPIQVCFSFI